MKFEPIFEWDEKNRCASCVLTVGNDTFYGTALCNEKDLDMMNEKTGCEIAYRRAKIKYLQHMKAVLKERLFALKQLYYAMKDSKRFNEKSYENVSLQRQMRFINSDLATVKCLIADEKQDLKTLIDEKDKFYITIRKNRQKAANKANLNK